MAILLDEEVGSGFEALDEEECFGLIHGRSIGRVAVSIGALPVVFPVNYHADDKVIYFLSGAGTKLAAATRKAVIAFQLDDIDIRYQHGWSVLAIGETSEVHDPVLLEIVSRFPLRPWAPGLRDHVVQIRPDFVSGRRITFREDYAGSH
jgi:nitroimidazol reductase NimA-like FMN-containing flavoprotein (pyridoxamine 5'-phosphate oxidase superfamily)